MTVGRRAIGVGAIGGDYLPAVVVPAPEPPAFPRRLFSIDLCVGWVRVAEAPAAVFDGITRDLLQGEWRLTGSVAALVFQAGFTIRDVDTIRVVRDADIVYSGLVAPVASGVGGLELMHGADGEQFALSGPDAWSVLAQRVCYPSPATGPPWADSWDVRTGLASSAAAGYINANAGSTATADRQIPGLTVVDFLAGATGSWSARLQPLDKQIARVCRDGGITCRLGISYLGALTATLGAPNNRSASVVLSDQGDLINIDQLRAPATATFVIAGGQGNLTARTFAAASTPAVGGARREQFTDQTSLSTLAEVAQVAATKLADAASSLTVRADVTDAAAAGLRYQRDYDVGDTIAVEVADVRYPVRVESVTVHVDEHRQVIRPILGPAVPDLVSGIIRDVAGLQSRFDTQIA